MNAALLAYGPLAVIAVAGVGYYLWNATRKKAPQVLVDAIDDAILEAMKDPAWINLSQQTKTAFINIIAAKGISRKSH